MFDLSSFPKKILYFVMTLVLVGFLFFPEVQKKPIKVLSLPAGTAVYYLQVISSGSMSGLGQIWDDYLYLINVQKENKLLRQSLASLQSENSRLREKEVMVDRLKMLLTYKEHSKVDTIVAGVIGRKPSQWFDTIMINKGHSDGIQIDMGVLSPQGIVGKIIDTGPHYAQVLLISDRNSAIGTMVQRTRDEGIAQGIDLNTLQLKYLPHDSKVSIGDVLVTSGMEGSFPKGLKIGQVKDIELREGEMFLKIKTTIGADIKKIEEVMVIRSIQNEEQP